MSAGAQRPGGRGSHVRTATGVLALLLALDCLGIVSAGPSWLAWGAPVGALGLALRLAGLGLLLGLRLSVLAPPARRLDGAWLTLLLLLLPALLEFHLAGGRLGGDGVSYYVYTRSLFADGDLDFSNEYAHFGLLTRGDLAMPTRTGLRRSIFALGPGLLALPFYAVGELAVRVQVWAGADPVADGYGRTHVNASALAGLTYGFAALVLVHAVLRRHFTRGTALVAVLLLWGATFLHWYMVQQPLMSHAPSAAVAALVLWLWERSRSARSARGWLALGLACGFAMCVRWQNALLLALPAWDLLAGVWRARRALPAVRRAELSRLAGGACLLALAGLLGVAPQLAAWKTIYGEWLLRHPPHGADFLRLDHPYVLETLFSSRHGLLSWTPVLWAGYLGFVPLWRRRPQLAAPLLPPLLGMTYINMCSGDWWAGGSFSNRRFDSLLPLLALGLAAAVDCSRSWAPRLAGLALPACGLPFVLWNLGLGTQVERGLLPRDDTLEFAPLVGQSWRVWAEEWGSPNTWPASWIFAHRHRLPPGRYDALVGRYLFYRQNNLQGLLDLGTEQDDAWLGEGWSRRQNDAGRDFRRLRGRARLFVVLDVPETLRLELTAFATAAGTPLRLEVNGRPQAALALEAGWSVSNVVVASDAWRREVNEIVLASPADGLLVDRLRAVRPERP